MAEPRRLSTLGHGPGEAAADALEWPGLKLQELPFRTIVVLHGRAMVPAFTSAVAQVLTRPPPDTPNTFVEASFGEEAVVLAWAGPEEWFVIGQEEGTSGLRAALRHALPDAEGAVVDVSSGYTLFSLEGRLAPDLIAAGCPIDVHPRAFGPGRCARTLFDRVEVCLLQRDATPRFEVMVRRSQADWLWRWISRAAGMVAVQ